MLACKAHANVSGESAPRARLGGRVLHLVSAHVAALAEHLHSHMSVRTACKVLTKGNMPEPAFMFVQLPS